MVISYRDSLKVVGIIIVCCCAVFVCTLFLNYNPSDIPAFPLQSISLYSVSGHL